MHAINMAHFLPFTENEGPGKRSVIWLQGCNLDCKGCCNLDLKPLVPVNIIEIADLMDQVRHAVNAYQLEGVTLLGGEPFLQARGLSVLAEQCQKENLSVMVFSGYTLEKLRNNPLPGSEQLLAQTDVLVDGPYQKRKPEQIRNWCGSSNQKFHYLSGRYGPAIETDPCCQPTMEVGIGRDVLRVSGYPL